MATINEQVTKLLQTLAPQYGGMVIPGTNEVMLFIREGEGMSIVFTFHTDDCMPYCETKYKAQGKDFTFDLRGHNASFYIETVADITTEIPLQIERVKKSQEQLASMVEFNLGPVKRFFAKDQLDKIVSDLKAGKTYWYQPGHMGIGYQFSTNPHIRNRWDRAQPSPELVKLVGRPVYISNFDAD